MGNAAIDRPTNGPSAYYGEKLNALTHIVGAVLALAGAIVLVVLAAMGGDPWKLVSVSLYGVTLVSLYSISGLYHSLRGRPKNVLRELDHQSIYLAHRRQLHAVLPGDAARSMGMVAARNRLGARRARRPAGTAVEKWRAHSVGRDLPADGVVAIGALVPLRQVLGPAGFAWLVAGGLCYTTGIVFYALDARMRHAHGVWHLFVLAGSACHYYAILRFVG